MRRRNMRGGSGATSRPAARRASRVGGAALAGMVAAGAVALLAAPPQGQQPSDVAVVISGDPGGPPPRYAVPDFVALTPEAAEAAATIGAVLWADLDFEREFYMIPRDTYDTVPSAQTPDEIPFQAWRELGADALVFGSVREEGDGLTVQVRLFDVRTRQTVFAREYYNASNPRAYAHTIADEIHLQQARGLRGVARTKISFASDRNRQRVDGTIEDREVKEIYIADYDGANQRRVTVSRRLNGYPSWSPDARAIAYTSWAPNPDIFVSFIYDGVLQNPTEGIGANYLPMFSPDGTRIAFMSARDGNPEIYVVNMDGTGLRRLTNHPAGDTTPTWSPTGTQIAFTSDRTGRPQIYVMNADGTGVERLTRDETEADRATWSPAPFNEIAFTGRTGPAWDIKVIDMATRQTRQLTDGLGSNEAPAYSPTGRHIAFTSTRSGGRQVFTMGRDGRGLRQVTRQGNNQAPAWSN